ncbi:MAG: hypothetical protein ACTSR2_02170 [Candidatus Hodarchaeales archaeon]
MKLKVSEGIPEKTKYDLADESLNDPFNSKIDDIESGPHLENLEPHPIPPGENKARMIPVQYRRLDPDWDVPNNRSFKKWTEERELWIRAWDDIAGLFSDILAVRVIQESSDCSRDASSPHQPEYTK